MSGTLSETKSAFTLFALKNFRFRVFPEPGANSARILTLHPVNRGTASLISRPPGIAKLRLGEFRERTA